ncbi:MAG: amino acid permease [bacterium]
MRSQGQPVRVLGLFDSICIIVGIIVGTGIFMTPMSVAQLVPSVPMILLAWTLAGAMCLAGALCYAELATTYPAVGGEYVYFSRSFGQWAGFLFSWSKMLVIRTGSIAAMAFAFGTYAEQVFPLGSYGVGLYASSAIIILTVVNIAGVRAGSTSQNILTVAKICGVVAVLVVAALYPAPSVSIGTIAESPTFPGFMVAMILILWTYGGWNETAYVAAEVRDPDRNLPRSITYGTLLVIFLYICINGAFLWTLGVGGVASSEAVAADCIGGAFGDAGRRFISVLVVVSALGAVNGLILTGARISYAMGAETALFGLLGRWNARLGVPVWSLLVQGTIAIALVWTGSFETLVEYTAAAAWLFFALVPLSLIVLRMRDSETPRKYHVPLYPFVPIIFCLVSIYMIYSSINYAGVGALYGFLIVLSGLPVYWFARRVG